MTRKRKLVADLTPEERAAKRAYDRDRTATRRRDKAATEAATTTATDRDNDRDNAATDRDSSGRDNDDRRESSLSRPPGLSRAESTNGTGRDNGRDNGRDRAPTDEHERRAWVNDQRAAARDWSAIAACPLCDGNGFVVVEPGAIPSVKFCDHATVGALELLAIESPPVPPPPVPDWLRARLAAVHESGPITAVQLDRVEVPDWRARIERARSAGRYDAEWETIKAEYRTLLDAQQRAGRERVQREHEAQERARAELDLGTPQRKDLE